MAATKSLEIRLQLLEQRYCGIYKPESIEAIHQVRIAQVFRQAALIYLLRLAKGEPANSERLKCIVNEALDTMGMCDFCERPWPLFVIAIEARTEDQRAVISTVLNASLKRQPYGTLALAQGMIHDAWALQDLREGEMDSLLLYGRVISRHHIPPCFT